MIKTNKFNEEVELTEIGIGTWAIGGPWQWGWGPQDDKKSIQTIEIGLEQGINWIDTAPAYGLGHAEEVVAQVLNNKRDQIFLATKCGLVWNAKGKKIRHNNRAENIRTECEASLKRLNTDYIDLYQIHWPDPNVEVEKSWEEMLKLKEEGKIRFCGVSNFNIELLEPCQNLGKVDSLQPPYSLLDRSIEKQILPWCKKNNVAVLGYSALQNGLLTGKYTPEKVAEMPINDWRKYDDQFKGEQLKQTNLFIEQLKPIADKYNKKVSQLTINWILCQRGITSALVGARTPEQINENILSSGWYLEKSDLDLIEQIQQKIFNN